MTDDVSTGEIARRLDSLQGAQAREMESLRADIARLAEKLVGKPEYNEYRDRVGERIGGIEARIDVMEGRVSAWGRVVLTSLAMPILVGLVLWLVTRGGAP